MLSLSYYEALKLQEQLYLSRFDGNCRCGQSLSKDLLRKMGKKDVDITEDDYKILNILKYGRNHSFHGNNTQYHVSQLVCAL